MLNRMVEIRDGRSARFRTIAILIGFLAAGAGFWSGAEFESHNHRGISMHDRIMSLKHDGTLSGDGTTANPLTAGTSLSVGNFSNAVTTVNASGGYRINGGAPVVGDVHMPPISGTMIDVSDGSTWYAWDGKWTKAVDLTGKARTNDLTPSASVANIIGMH